LALFILSPFTSGLHFLSKGDFFSSLSLIFNPCNYTS
jgi:hypothetical protein